MTIPASMSTPRPMTWTARAAGATEPSRSTRSRTRTTAATRATLGFSDTTNAQVRDINGRRYVFMEDSHAESMTIYRVDGELLTQVGEIPTTTSTSRATRRETPGTSRATASHATTSRRGTGTSGSSARTSAAYGAPRHRLQLPRERPIYSWAAVDVYPMPTEISGGNAGRIEVQGRKSMCRAMLLGNPRRPRMTGSGWGGES